MSRKVINFAAFNLNWYLCVTRLNLVGPAVVGWTLVPHFALVTNDRRRSALVLLVAGVAGTIADTVLERAGLLTFAGGPRIWLSCPLWIAALWVNFGTTLHGCLAWIQTRLPLAAVLGAIAGPGTYLLAESMGAVTLHGPGAVAAVAAEYAIATPLLLLFARKGSPDA